LRRFERRNGQEVRAGLFGVGQRKAAPDEPYGRSVGFRRDRLRSDRVSLRLAPLRLVVAQPSTKLGQLRSPRHAVFRLPAVRSLELLLGENLRHVDILGCPARRGGLESDSTPPE